MRGQVIDTIDLRDSGRSGKWSVASANPRVTGHFSRPP